MIVLTGEEIGGYYDRHQAHLDAGLPEEGRAHLRERYIRDARNNPQLLREINRVLRQEWRERRAQATGRHRRITDAVFRYLRAGQPPLAHDWLGQVAVAAEQFARIVDRDAHPDDVDLAQTGMSALAGIWLTTEQIEALWLGGDGEG